jgi:hypothetical protein
MSPAAWLIRKSSRAADQLTWGPSGSACEHITFVARARLAFCCQAN